MITDKEGTISTKHYYNIGQLRADLWGTLRSDVNILCGRSAQPKKDEAVKSLKGTIKNVSVVEQYFAFPGKEILDVINNHLKRGEYHVLKNTIQETIRMLVSEDFRHHLEELSINNILTNDSTEQRVIREKTKRKNYFEVLFVDNISEEEEQEIKQKLHGVRMPDDRFSYETVFTRSFEDSFMALIFNPNIQTAVIRYGIPYKSKHTGGILKSFIPEYTMKRYEDNEQDLGLYLGKVLSQLRPELDIFYVTDSPVNRLSDGVLKNFQRIFYHKEDIQELHLSMMRSVKARYHTPFFKALKEYSQKPAGVFHAMPISRGNSVFKSNWIDDFGDFYGRNLFLAETSSTTGGLDSLLQPTGPLKKALELAAKTFGSRKTYFATNGTSTSNKVVLQALVEPGDIVLVDRDCHKSHHYGMVLSGATVTYLDSYPLTDYSMYGAVPLHTIKERLLTLKDAGRLDKVKMLLLTNCTFDGIVYNVEKVMEEVLAIKPDMVFLWDEAWFGFAAFTHTYRQRTAMCVAHKLSEKYKKDSYRKTYEKHIADLKKKDPNAVPKMPDPDKVKIRVYATQSTHKTLSSFRQGSMIHIYDQEFERRVEESFDEAYMTHTSTSPNYQILASLDVGRRQAAFEGFELVEKSIEMAMLIRAKINDHPKLNKYFKVLTIKDLIKDEYRQSGLSEYYNPEKGWARLSKAWAEDEFVLDPTKINIGIGNTGVDGDTFKNKYLMDQYQIQINKTSRNSVLFMTNIGTTRSSVSYLISSLLKIADDLDHKFASYNPQEEKLVKKKIHSLTIDTPPLPHFSHFHASFRAVASVPGGNIREAYFLAYKEENCEFVKLSDCIDVMNAGREIVSASFVIPYPPGFPVLVPGQVMTADILNFLLALDVKEIHGFKPELGLRVFTGKALNRFKSGTAMRASGIAIGMKKTK